jgi:ribonuclease HII
VAGVDEAGRGAWAGPVTVSVALLDLSRAAAVPPRIAAGLRDPKLMKASKRWDLREDVVAWLADFRVVHVPPAFIDEHGMTAALSAGLRQGLASLGRRVDLVLIDGRGGYACPLPHDFVVRGDSSSLLIAAAALLAKTSRDALMRSWGSQLPFWRFAAHVGYGTREHLRELWGFGLSSLHRRSWGFRTRIPWGTSSG